MPSSSTVMGGCKLLLSAFTSHFHFSLFTFTSDSFWKGLFIDAGAGGTCLGMREVPFGLLTRLAR